MKWVIINSTVSAALGAGPVNSAGPMPQHFLLTGPDGMEAEGTASEDVVSRDVLEWARVAHGFESYKVLTKAQAKARAEEREGSKAPA